jgi:hypothetical protein
VLKLLSDSALRTRLGQQARRTVLESFTAEHQVAAYTQLYEQLARDGKAQRAEVLSSSYFTGA